MSKKPSDALPPTEKAPRKQDPLLAAASAYAREVRALKDLRARKARHDDASKALEGDIALAEERVADADKALRGADIS